MEVTSTESPIEARAFNLGSDARIDGVQFSNNPYDKSNKLYFQWNLGWLDVHLNWAKNRPYIWKVNPIPKIPYQQTGLENTN